MKKYHFGNSKVFGLFLCFILMSFVGWGQQETGVERVYDSLIKQFGQGSYDLSILNSRKFLRQYKEQHRKEDTLLASVKLNLSACMLNKYKYDSAIHYSSQAISLMKKLNKERHAIVENAYYNLSSAYKLLNRLDKAIIYARKSLELSKDLDRVNGDLYQKYNNVGVIHYAGSDIDSALFYLEKALEVKKERGGGDLEIGQSIVNLGVIAYKKGDYVKALEYYRKGIALMKKGGASNFELSEPIYNIGVVFYFMKDYQKAIDYIKQAVSFTQNDLTNAYEKKVTLAMVHNEMKEFEKALAIYHDVQKFYIKTHGDNFPRLYGVYFNIANTYRNLKQLEEAFKFNKKALMLLEKLYGGDHLKVIVANYQLGTLYEKQEEWGTASKYYEIAIDAEQNQSNHFTRLAFMNLGMARVCLGLKKHDKIVNYLKVAAKELRYDIAAPLEFDAVIDAGGLQNYFLIEGERLRALYGEFKDEKYLDSIGRNFDHYIGLQEHMQQQLFSAKSKSFQFNNASGMYSLAIDHWLKSNGEKAFEIVEKTKSRQLLSSLASNKIKFAALLPDSLMQRESDLSQRLSELKKDQYIKKKSKEAVQDSLMFKIEKKIEACAYEKQLLDEYVRKVYPKFHRLKNSHHSISVEELQSRLGVDQTLVEYFVNNQTLYVFVVKKDKMIVKSMKLDFNLRDEIGVFRKGVYEIYSNSSISEDKLKGNSERYVLIASLLYNAIWKPIEHELTEKVIIVPDQALCYLPFEALLTDVNDSHSYLLKKYQISYTQSATFYGAVVQRGVGEAKYNALTLAPSFKVKNEAIANAGIERNGFGSLSFNKEEATAVVDLLGGSALIGNKATKSNFLNKLNDYRVLHLATHAKSHEFVGDFSFVAFQEHDSIRENNHLYVPELYKLELNSDLVVLSACETGLGEWRRGEGIIGLSRAFIAAGINSTVTSLWNVNDAQTAKLMVMFYDNLKDGMTKDKALRLAKLKYLEEESMTAPYFWAGFVPYGDMRPLKLNHSKGLVWGIGLLLIAIGGGIMYYDKKKSA